MIKCKKYLPDKGEQSLDYDWCVSMVECQYEVDMADCEIEYAGKKIQKCVQSILNNQAPWNPEQPIWGWPPDDSVWGNGGGGFGPVWGGGGYGEPHSYCVP